LGGKAKAVKLDVSDFAAVENLLQDTVKRTGKLDFMFNNAGIFLGGPIGRHAISDWNRIIDVNLRGAVNGTHAAYQIMKRQGFGRIVNTASTMGLLPVGLGMPAYATIKHAIVALSTTLRAELSLEGIRISVLCPGVIQTPILINGGKYWLEGS
jgi:NAD(P)-dependent dehydrogenase (short-subunit alcohol dehydrogenase family)